MSQIVYWSNLSELPDEIMTPKPLLQYMAEAQSGHKGENFLACPSILTRHKNTFFTTFPTDILVDFKTEYASDDLVNYRTGLYENSYAFDWGIKRIFFSEEPQVIEVSPAFLHKTSYSRFGHSPSGAYDIGKWFRPSFPTFQLWSGESKFWAEEGEAHLYFNFPSENKIILQKFVMSPELIEIMHFCSLYKTHVPKQSLPSNYEVFSQEGLKEKVIKEIKNNLY